MGEVRELKCDHCGRYGFTGWFFLMIFSPVKIKEIILCPKCYLAFCDDMCNGEGRGKLENVISAEEMARKAKHD